MQSKHPYVKISTDLLIEQATMYDQILVRYRPPSALVESAGGLLQLANPAAGYVVLQSLHKRDSDGKPVEMRVSTTDDIQFLVQEHHLRKLRTRDEYERRRELQRIIRPLSPASLSDKEPQAQSLEISPSNTTKRAPRLSKDVMPPRFFMKKVRFVDKHE